MTRVVWRHHLLFCLLEVRLSVLELFRFAEKIQKVQTANRTESRSNTNNNIIIIIINNNNNNNMLTTSYSLPKQFNVDEAEAAWMAALTLSPLQSESEPGQGQQLSFLRCVLDSILSDNFTWEEICIIENYLENNEDNDNDVILKAALQHATR